MALRLKSDFAPTFTNRGNAKASMGNHQEAIADLDRAVELDPDNGSTRFYRGYVKAHLNRHQEALADNDEGIKLGFDDPLVFGLRVFKPISKNIERLWPIFEAIKLDTEDSIPSACAAMSGLS